MASRRRGDRPAALPLLTVSEQTGSPNPEQQISEEQVRAYLEQLRSAPAEQILSELLGLLLNGAQAKLGRNDARLLIDLSALMVDHAGPHLPPEFATQVNEALGQLRLAQVQAENAAGNEPEPNDLPQRPASPGESAAPSGQTPPPPPPASPPSGLWVPGQ